ncbi:hypothetical protein L6164_000427 [Bauhinia variegata]|uniref:Uncharacterized protein n=1 Tax=Bauhinia variegata TaxID=167791 RepID=A0ACB9Q8Q9_BAUVA|nr:hypothetical protein L6164_000427 [Bauhinia variegata]
MFAGSDSPRLPIESFHSLARVYIFAVLLPQSFPRSLSSHSSSGPFSVSDLVWLSKNRSIMTRGNQRERDRERAQGRNSGKGKQVKDDGLTPEQRRERDAKALQEKAARKAAQQAAGGNNAGGQILARPIEQSCIFQNPRTGQVRGGKASRCFNLFPSFQFRVSIIYSDSIRDGR